MKRFAGLWVDLFLAAGTALSIALSGMTDFSAHAENVCSEVLRLHIPANSDSERDQELKLALRDELLRVYGEKLSECSSLSDAEERAQLLLDEISDFASGFLRENGADYGARAELVTMYFTTRKYDNITLPAGEYRALRVTLGSGEGHNWWCIMFPALCLPSASKALEDESAAALEKEFGNTSPQIRFALYEWIKNFLD